MASTVEFSYFLPITMARLQCTVTTSTDKLLQKTASKASEWTVELVVQADPDCRRTVRVHSGFWRDYAFSLGLSEDGRLTRAGIESTGQVGTVLAAAIPAAVGLAALAGGSIPLAIASIGAATGLTNRDRGPGAGLLNLEEIEGLLGVDADEDLRRLEELTGASRDPVAEAYAAAHPQAARRLAELGAELDAARQLVDTRRRAYAQATEDTNRGAARRGYLAARTALGDCESELERAKAHVTAWRRSTITETESPRDLLVPLGALPSWQQGTLTFPPGAQGAAVHALFEETGRTLATVPELVPEAAPPPAEPAAGGPAPADRLHVRRPRAVQLVSLVTEAGRTTVAGVHRELVMDADCPEEALAIRRSWNGKRRLDLQLSDRGALIGVELNGTSSAAGASAAAAQGIGAISGALESAGKSQSALEGLAGAEDRRTLAALKQQVAIAEQQLLAAGMAATAADHERLARLKQAVEEAELRVRLQEASTALG